MDRTVIDALYDNVVAGFRSLAEATDRLTDSQLDQRVPAFGGREVGVRQLLYQAVTHSREHAVHLSKIMQATAAPGARPTEAQLILGQIAESLGALHGALMRLTDADLDREHDGHSPRKVLEHVANTNRNYARYIAEGLSRD